MRIPDKLIVGFELTWCVLLTYLIICFVVQNFTGIPQLRQEVDGIQNVLQKQIDVLNIKFGTLEPNGGSDGNKADRAISR